MNCPTCQVEIFDVDVKCANCGTVLGATGAHRMIGTLILGTYELVDVLGQGGMSVVFKAKHKMTDQEVALKILPPELAAHSQVKSRFLEEAKALAALDHPNIVHLYNFGQENGSFVLAMQFVRGKTWERAILENKRLDWKITCRIAIDVLKALEYAHGRGVVHRDMKPSNVLVRESDGAATVMDFGIAKMTTSTKLTAEGQTMGTVRYMSPEQVRGQEVDLRTDLYSLGATIYESLVGDTPFDGSTHFEIMTKHLSELPKAPSTHGVEVPRDVEDAIMRSLAKKAGDRFESARDLRKILENALRTGDVGLVETQRINREILGDLKSTKDERPSFSTPSTADSSAKALAPTARSATASDLADELEPGTTSAQARIGKPKSKLPWIILALLVVLGGGATGAVMVLGAKRSPSYQARTKIKGVTLAQGKRVGTVFVETDGKVTPEEVEVTYEAVLQDIKEFEPQIGGKRDVIEEIVAIPQTELCNLSIVRASRKPCNASDTATTALNVDKRQLLVSSDRATLADNLRFGVANAVCDFQFLLPEMASGTDEVVKKLDAICEMTKRFATPK
ncbi:MAG TPA: serine/threonine-protein kinase [Kofleriaceae bacterium]|nr:serine/threonine-protein kinase [Kofleriaceae bacterium]